MAAYVCVSIYTPVLVGPQVCGKYVSIFSCLCCLFLVCVSFLCIVKERGINKKTKTL